MWVGAALILAGAAGVVVWRNLGEISSPLVCPSCRSVLQTIDRNQTNTSYEVALCPHCPEAITLVHGQASGLSYCRECRQRSMEVAVVRTANPDVVEVHEDCHLCRAGGVVTVGRPKPPGSGNVIEFPGPR